jgi:hypothetical protein
VSIFFGGRPLEEPLASCTQAKAAGLNGGAWFDMSMKCEMQGKCPQVGFQLVRSAIYTTFSIDCRQLERPRPRPASLHLSPVARARAPCALVAATHSFFLSFLIYSLHKKEPRSFGLTNAITTRNGPENTPPPPPPSHASYKSRVGDDFFNSAFS